MDCGRLAIGTSADASEVRCRARLRGTRIQHGLQASSAKIHGVAIRVQGQWLPDRRCVNLPLSARMTHRAQLRGSARAGGALLDPNIPERPSTTTTTMAVTVTTTMDFSCCHQMPSSPPLVFLHVRARKSGPLNCLQANSATGGMQCSILCIPPQIACSPGVAICRANAST